MLTQDTIDKAPTVNPNDPEYVGSVYILFADGELSITKAGQLFGLHGLHMFRPPKRPTAYAGVKWPSEYCGHPCMFIDDDRTADRIRKLIPLDNAAKLTGKAGSIQQTNNTDPIGG